MVGFFRFIADNDRVRQADFELMLLNVQINGIRPELDAVSAWCKTSTATSTKQSQEGDDVASVRAEVKLLWTDHHDRGIDQDVLLWIECDAGPLLRHRFGMSDALPATFTQEDIGSLDSVSLDFAFEHKIGNTETSTSGSVPLTLWYTAADVDVQLHKPEEKVKMAACLSPAFYDSMPLLKWLEWREHMKRIGTERVNWYGRQMEMEQFVNAYNKLAGTKDIFRYVRLHGALPLAGDVHG